MSTIELHFDFDFKLDKLATLTKPDINVGEKDWLLNEAQSLLIKRYYMGNNSSFTAFETVQKRNDDLSSLVVKYPDQPLILPTLIVDSGVYELDLNTLKYPYMFFVRGTVTTIKKSNSSCVTEASMKLISHDDINSALKDPFNNTDSTEVLFNFGRSSSASTANHSRSSIYLYPGIYSLGGIKIEYIKYPQKINYGGYAYIDGVTYPIQQCELPIHVHSEIVDLAVQIASGIIESPEYMQLKAQKVFMHE